MTDFDTKSDQQELSISTSEIVKEFHISLEKGLDSKDIENRFSLYGKNINKSDNTVSIGKLFGDGDHDDKEIFRYLGDKGILPCIKVRKNAKVQWKKGNILRNLAVLEQKNDLQNWKDHAIWTKMDY
ncbi:MAG TPA: cation-transporting P-type ATPase [Verrucomicrobiae bacterium]|nr:cation-transporting P-type ATPase [Verrucomicrobiae bacterium]